MVKIDFYSFILTPLNELESGFTQRLSCAKETTHSITEIHFETWVLSFELALRRTLNDMLAKAIPA